MILLHLTTSSPYFSFGKWSTPFLLTFSNFRPLVPSLTNKSILLFPSLNVLNLIPPLFSTATLAFLPALIQILHFFFSLAAPNFFPIRVCIRAMRSVIKHAAFWVVVVLLICLSSAESIKSENSNFKNGELPQDSNLGLEHNRHLDRAGKCSEIGIESLTVVPSAYVDVKAASRNPTLNFPLETSVRLR